MSAVTFRRVIVQDVPNIAECRSTDPSVHPADPRMTAYFEAEHHPQHALQARTGYVAVAEGRIIGYVAGHLTTRHGCEGELQYLFVAPRWRRQGVATALTRLLARWFQENAARQVCVNVDPDSPAALPFYRSQGAGQLSPKQKYWYVWQDVGQALSPAAIPPLS